MARRFKRGLDASVRGLVRMGVRQGKTRKDIVEEVEDKYGIGPTRKLVDMIRQEERREATVSDLRRHPLDKRPDYEELAGCGGKTGKLIANITIVWESPLTGLTYIKGYAGAIDRRLTLGEAIQQLITDARQYYIDNKYDPPPITVGDKSGKNYYRLEYLECV